jgi:hypothetical protein
VVVSVLLLASGRLLLLLLLLLSGPAASDVNNDKHLCIPLALAHLHGTPTPRGQPVTWPQRPFCDAHA